MSGSKYLYPAPLPSEIKEAKIELSCKTEGLFEGCDIKEIELARKFGGSYEKRSFLGIGFLAGNYLVFPSAGQAAAFSRALEATNEFRSPSDEILDLPFDTAKKVAKGVGDTLAELLKSLGLNLKTIMTLLLVVGGVVLTITLTKK